MDQAAKGATALSDGKYDEAIDLYSKAIAKQPQAVDYYIKRSTAYQRASPAILDAALADAETAVILAHRRAKRELISQAQLRRTIALFSLGKYTEADKVLSYVRKFDEKEKSLDIWQKKISDKLSEHSSANAEEDASMVTEIPEVDRAAGLTQIKSTSISLPPYLGPTADTTHATSEQQQHQQHAQTAREKIRHEWYQNNENVYITIFAKGVPSERTTFELTEKSLVISFPSKDFSTFDFSLDPLFANVNTAASSHHIVSTKIEMILKKANLGHKWTSLEGSTSVPVISTAVDSPTTEKDHAENAAAKAAVTFIPVYPTSSRSGPKDWDKVTADLIRESRKEGKDNGDGRTEADLDELEEEGGDPVNAFFKKIYADADPDTRRAMMKSYQESSGTTLSTNWSEVSQGTVDTSPPDGMVARKWNE